jgi:hypothetical protein
MIAAHGGFFACGFPLAGQCSQMQQDPAWGILARLANIEWLNKCAGAGFAVLRIRRRDTMKQGTTQAGNGMLLRGLLVVGLSWALFACAGTTPLNDTPDANGVPGWVNVGSSILTSKAGRRFQGVGSAPMLGDFSLQTSTADKRARGEINRILASYVEIVSRDFIASGDAEEAGLSEQNIAQQMAQLANIDLVGIQVIGHWQDTQSKVIYSIAEVNMQQVREAIKLAETLHPGLREFIQQEGNGIFDRVATSED